MTKKMTIWNRALVRVSLVLLCLLTAAMPGRGQAAEELRLTVGKSVVIDYPADVRQISTSNPEIVDASPITTREILLHGKGLGSATMVVWSRAGERMFYNITVELNLDPLRRILRETFPNEQMTVTSSRDSLTINGPVTTKEVADRVVGLTSSFAKTVVNNMKVGVLPVDKQILLRVRFAELDRSRQEQYGVNWIGTPGGTAISTTTGQFGSTNFVPDSTPGSRLLGTFTIPQAINAFAYNKSLGLGAFLKALQTEGILQILAEPNLVTTNGKEAYFLVGGEFPVPVLQGGSNAGAVTVQFREFGIRLRFTPNITENNTLKLHIGQEVSTIDVANGVSLGGFSIPALATRKAETDVELGEGQSFVIAGLLDNRETESLSKLPIIGDIPILGNLFKSKDIKRNRTDLVLIVTPEITLPLNPNEPRPDIVFPKDFLVRLNPEDLRGTDQYGNKVVPKGSQPVQKKK